MNKRFYIIRYEVEGSRNLDNIMIWSDSIANAVKEFINTEIDYGFIKIKYTEYSIRNIQC